MLQLSHDDIKTALKTWFKPGEVFEIRILDALTKRWNTKEHTEAGYFNYEFIDQIPTLLEERLISYKGIYVTINPLNPAVIGRSMNRFKSEKLIGAKDEEVLCRRWLLIDCDAKRVSGVSSSDEEHTYALQKAQEIKTKLFEIGWPLPIELDSGNGAQLMYRIDLPIQDDGLVKRCLEQLKAASDEHVDIDQTVFNPARLWRLPGAWNCKGDECKEQSRIHRQSRILCIPSVLEPVPQSTLLRLAPPTETPEYTLCEDSFDIHSFVSTHFPNAKAQSYAGGTKWVLETCPFNPDHNDRSAVIIQASDGRLGFRCHHNGCTGRNWHDLRNLLAPKEALPPIDVSNLLKKAQTTPEEITIEEPIDISHEETPSFDDESDTPWGKMTTEFIQENVLKDTLFGAICEQLSVVSDPPLPLELVILKALVLIGAALTGAKSNCDNLNAFGIQRAKLKINTGGGQALNFYGLLAAPSGTGKDIGGLLDHMAMRYRWLVGTSGSAEGLADRLIERPNGIIAISELQPWLDPKRWQHAATEFLVFTFNKGFFEQALSKRNSSGNARCSSYCYPNVLANVQPDIFTRVAKEADLENGFLSRFLYVCAPRFDCEPGMFDLEIVVNKISEYIDRFRHKEGTIDVPLRYSSDLKKELSKAGNSNLTAFVNRLCNEYYPRLAAILSVRNDDNSYKKDVVITEDDWERARNLVYWFYKNANLLLPRVEDIDDKTRRYESIARKVLEKIVFLQQKGGLVTRARISRSGIRNTSSEERMKAISELLSRGWIQEVAGKGFRHVYTPPEWR